MSLLTSFDVSIYASSRWLEGIAGSKMFARPAQLKGNFLKSHRISRSYQEMKSSPLPLTKAEIAIPWLLVPALLLLLIVLPNAYSVTVGEPDLARMVYGFVRGATSGAETAAGGQYGLEFSFGYYRLFYAALPDEVLGNPDAIARAMNMVGLISACLVVLLFSLFVARSFGSRVGLAAGVLAGLSPVFLLLASSAHPILLATAIALAGALVLSAVGCPSSRTVNAILATLALALFVAALTIRAEVVLIFPFILLAARPAALSKVKRNWRMLLLYALVLSLSFAIFTILQRPYIATDHSGRSFFRFIESFWRIEHTARSSGVFALTCGLGTILAGFFLAVLLRGHLLRSRQHLLIAAALALPALVFWFPVPQPARHFLFAVFGLALITALLADHILPRSLGRVAAFALAIAVLNQVLAEAVRPIIVRRYAWVYPAIVERRSTPQVPLGQFFADQRANLRKTLLIRDEAIKFLGSDINNTVFVGEDLFCVLAHVLSRFPDARVEMGRQRDGLFVVEIAASDLGFAAIDKSGVWPRDGIAAVLAAERFAEWRIYVQPSSISKYDSDTVPEHRRVVPVKQKELLH